MTFFVKRARAALSAFMQPPAVKSAFGINGIYDVLYGGGVVGRNRDLSFTEQGAAAAFGLNTGLQRSIKFKQDAIGMLDGGVYDGKTDALLIGLHDRTLDMSLPGATFIAAMRSYARRWYHDYIGSIIFSNNLYGETYVQRLSNPMGGITGVRWLNPLWVEPVEQQGRIAYYQYYAPNMASDDKRRVEVQEMAFNIYHPNPNDDLRGMPPVLSALDSINVERNEKRAVQAYFRNGMNPGGAMGPKTGDHLTDIEIQKMQTRFQQIYGGVDNMFRWLITPTEFVYQAFEQPDLQKNWSIIKEARLEVMMAIGVPVELAGDPSGTKYENADKVMQNWLRVNGKAEATGISGYITDTQLRYFEPDADVYFGFDFSPFERQEAALVQADFSGGAITVNEARAERGYKTDDRLNGILNWNGKPVHIDTLVQIARDPAAFTGQPPAPALQQPVTIPALPAGQPAPQEQSEPQKGATSLAVMLSLANNPDLIDLQKRLKDMFSDPAVRWNNPADFHATLLYVPAVEEEGIAPVTDYLDSAPLPELAIEVGSLACFDHVAEHALHFRVPRNGALLDYQAALHEACEGMGLQSSSYSNPAQYTPHITMGYLPERVGRIVFHGKVRVTPAGVICSVERGGEYEVVYPVEEPTKTLQLIDEKFDPNQPRADDGKFGSGSGISQTGNENDPDAGDKPKPESGSKPDKPRKKPAAQIETGGEQHLQRIGRSGDDVLHASGMKELPVELADKYPAKISTTQDINGVTSVKVQMGDDSTPFNMERTLSYDKDGNLTKVHNERFFLPNEYQGTGEGTRIFHSQVEGLRSQSANGKYPQIETLAGKGEGMNGYYTWGRLGYDSTVDVKQHGFTNIPDSVKPSLTGSGPFARRDYHVSDFMKSPEGRDYWKKNGYQTTMFFDTNPDSLSSKVLDSYMSGKK